MKYIYIHPAEDRVLCTSPKQIDELRQREDVQEYAVPDDFDLTKEVEPSVFLEGFLTPAEFLARLDANYSARRAAQYPSLGDQLDALFHAGVFPPEMAALIQAVKDANPKPEA